MWNKAFILCIVCSNKSKIEWAAVVNIEVNEGSLAYAAICACCRVVVRQREQTARGVEEMMKRYARWRSPHFDWRG